MAISLSTKGSERLPHPFFKGFAMTLAEFYLPKACFLEPCAGRFFSGFKRFLACGFALKSSPFTRSFLWPIAASCWFASIKRSPFTSGFLWPAALWSLITTTWFCPLTLLPMVCLLIYPLMACLLIFGNHHLICLLTIYLLMIFP